MRSTVLVALVATMFSAAAEAKPDLVITDITLDPASPNVGDGNLTATIKNIGPDDAGGTFSAINLVMYLDGKECATGLIISGLDAGATATEETGSCNPSTPGPHTIKFVVDTDNDIDESNEGNNALEKTFTWAGPDLVVTSVTIDPATPKVTEGKITATIKNKGPYGTGTFVNINLKMFLDGKECDTGIIYAGLGAGSEATEETTSCNASSVGPHVFRIEVDTDADVPEQDETNNAFEQTLSWFGGPDLVITDIVLDPAEPKVGDGNLTATIKNQGDAGTGILVNINLKMFLDGEECATGLIIAGLGAGSEATEETGSCNPDKPGPHVIRFEVDTDGDVTEADESNNFLEKTFTWTAPNLVVTKIELDPAQPKPGEKIKFTATLKNIGTVDTDNAVIVNVQFFLDDGAEACADGLVFFGLDAGAEATEETTGCNPETPGTHTIKAVVDTKEDVVETDETDNALSVEFSTCGTAEICNGKDDTCDGKTDEGFAGLGDACDGNDADKCTDGKKACAADGKTVECVEPGVGKEEACNGQDDDCDGQKDEDFLVGGKCTATVGACETAGKNVCSTDGKTVVCEADAASGTETCNGKDDNCDGKTDEGFDEVGAACANGIGACRAFGKYGCGTGAVVCDAKAGAPAGSDTCDNDVDDDCDGLTDEGCGCAAGTFLTCGSSVGACTLGTQACGADGKYAATCAGAVASKTEACGNSVDDDCDGAIDEACPCTGTSAHKCDTGAGVCAAGEQHCINAKWGPCLAKDLAVEDCDDKDDDCDGEVDEGCDCTPGESMSCAAAPDQCAEYVRSCSSGGQWLPCSTKEGTAVPGCGTTPGEDTAPPPGSDVTTSGDTSTPPGGDVTASGDAAAGADAKSPAQPVVGGGGGCAADGGSSARPLALLLALLGLALLVRRRAA